MRRSLCSLRREASSLVTLRDHTITVGHPPRTLVAGLTLSIRQGERWAILGENGCGKTMTAQLLGRCIGGASGHTLALTPSSAIASVADVDKRNRDVVHVSFESHRRLLQDESREFRESRFDVTNLRATLASFLFPELYPEDPAFPAGYQGYTPKNTRLAPLPVPYDADGSHASLAALEEATSTGRAGRLLQRFGLHALRHRPVHAMSTGEARKMMIVDCLLSPPQLTVLDEAFDGLDASSRDELRDVLLASFEEVANEGAAADDGASQRHALALIAHHEADLVPSPTHALLLGQGPRVGDYQAGEWRAMAPAVKAFFASQRLRAGATPLASHRPSAAWPASTPRLSTPSSPAPTSPAPSAARSSEVLVDFRGVSIRYPGGGAPVLDGLRWSVRAGEKWVVLGGNGSGKSTLVELVSGDNLLGYTQPLWLFGQRKGSGESVWQVKSRLGVLSTEAHMEYLDYADPSVASFAGNGRKGGVSTWEVLASGFFDAIGMRGHALDSEQVARAESLVAQLGLQDLITPPTRAPAAEAATAAAVRGHARRKHGAETTVEKARRLARAAAAEKAAEQAAKQGLVAAADVAAPAVDVAAPAADAAPAGPRDFFHLSHGQQKLVLLCRALVKRPRLLLLDEPTHGLSGAHRARLLATVRALASDGDVAVVYVTHRHDEIDALGFSNVLELHGAGKGYRIATEGRQPEPELADLHAAAGGQTTD